MVDSSFFWGYLITQIPGGFLASFFPANRIFGIAICTSALLNMTIPGAMKLENVTVLLMIRVLQGLVEVRIISNKNTLFLDNLQKPDDLLLNFELGCCIPSMSWYLEILGATTRTITTSDYCILWFLCRNCDWYAYVRDFGTVYQLAGTILFLFNMWYILVCCLALVSF